MPCEIRDNYGSSNKYVICEGSYDHEDAFEMAVKANTVSECGFMFDDSNAGILAYCKSHPVGNEELVRTEILGSFGLGITVKESSEREVKGPLIGILWTSLTGYSSDSSCPLQASLLSNRFRGNGRTNQLAIVFNNAISADAKMSFEASLLAFDTKLDDGLGINLWDFGVNVENDSTQVSVLSTASHVSKGSAQAAMLTFRSHVRSDSDIYGLINFGCVDDVNDYFGVGVSKLFHCGSNPDTIKGENLWQNER